MDQIDTIKRLGTKLKYVVKIKDQFTILLINPIIHFYQISDKPIHKT